jgi:BON domain-containing protein
MRKRATEGRRRAGRGLRPKPATGRIRSVLNRRTDRSALELASGSLSVPPAVPALLAGGGFGALLTYFLDPRRGKARRARARGRAAGVARRGRKEFDDAGLAAKVETVLFGDRRIPKGALNVNAEKGVVIIRGEVERSDRIRKIERAVRRIGGVGEVRNLLHTPDSPAPNKAAALRASSRAAD